MSDEPDKNLTTSPLSGFMELLPAEQLAFNRIYDTIRRSYEAFGFIPIDTPVLERAEVLLAKAGGETEKQIYRFRKGDTDLAMRFDLTVPLARYVAEHCGQLVLPFRRYAMGKVYRGERAQAGRFREFYQCDIDVIGDGELDLRFDAEIPSVIHMIFRQLGFERFTIRINNRKIFGGLFRGLGIERQSVGIMQAVDRLEKVGPEAVRKELAEMGLPEPAIGRLFDFVGLGGTCDEIIAGLRKMGIDDGGLAEGISELETVVGAIRQFGVPDANFAVDLTIARGLDYYTGTVYETRLDDYPEIGSVCSGGRYDDLASHYTDRKLPGVGISIGLTRLFDQLYRRGVLKTGGSTTTKALILPMTEDMGHCFRLATRLREAGIATEVSFVSGKMKKRLGYADRLGIPFVVFVGDDEIRKGTYTLKDFREGDQEELTEAELIRKLV
ncbi:histidine--tRNA ligase [Candidatus Uhrbacteria bacterium]|nr:histidine--tRNA ligase [Candidatus Uhrbacteria bacterium]